jgi:hypothetical protein
MNNSENFGSLLSAASIAALVMEVITQSSIAIVVEIRTGWPFRHFAEELSGFKYLIRKRIYLNTPTRPSAFDQP